jgi:site-specific recombinase
MAKFWLKNKDKSQPAKKQAAIVLPIDSSSRSLELLVELVKKIRPSSPKKKEEAELKFKALLFQLQQDRSMLFAIRRSLLTQFANSNIIPALIESGIIHSRGFVQELTGKIKHKILPALQKPNDFLFVINRVFYLKTDYKWVNTIDTELWKQFFEMLGIQVNLTDNKLQNQLNRSFQILSYRAATIGLEKEVIQNLENVDDIVDPFLEQNRLINLYLERFASHSEEENKMLLANIEEALHNCKQSIQSIQEQRSKAGTSLAQTFLLVRLQQQIERMFIILDVLDRNQEFNTERFIAYFHAVIRNENRKNSLGEFLNQNLGLLAYQIAEHKGKRGEQYITSSPKDFRNLFFSALGGGLIVSFVAIIKNMIGLLKLPLFWQGFLYGTNYAVGFITMDQTRSTLATKQPAYTASAVAGSLDKHKLGERPDLRNLVITIARVSRSQIASFAGNLIVVFPLTYILAWLFHLAVGYKLAADDAALKLLHDQHPFDSLALLFACFTGFFLFLSGIIAGYVENHIVNGKIAERIQNNHAFVNTMSPKKLKWIVNLVEKHSGAIAGSVALGFFLGVAGPLGKFLGIPFDIRHITISAANTSIGMYGLDNNVAFSYFLVVLAGVLMIGFLNFLISFVFAFIVAIRSRGIVLSEYPEFFGILWRYMKKHPKDFLLPPRQVRTVEELK